VPPSLRPPADGTPPSPAELSASGLVDAAEVARLRVFSLLSIVLPISILLLLPFLGGDTGAREVFAGAVGLAAFGSAWIYWSIERDERYDLFRILVAGVLWLTASLASLDYFGIFSAAALLLPLGVFFFAMTRDARVQVLAYLAAALSYFGLAVHTLRAGARGGGIVDAGALVPAQAIVFVALTETVMLVTFVATKAVRSTMMVAIGRHDRAAGAAAQKDARLLELQKDLAHALDVAGVGRFSDTVVGAFRLGDVIGRGAMGEVYEATHETSHAEAAVKVLHPHTMRDKDAVERFVREGKMAAAVETKHVVAILDVKAEGSELPYLAMERLRGEDLSETLRRSPQLPLVEITRLVSEVGDALVAARRAGVVHRDVKPRNLFLARGASPGETVWKLLDFGVATRVSEDTPHDPTHLVGTPEYMAPEQASGEPVTYKADLFSLGAVVYRAITGAPAFGGDHIAEVLYEVTHGMPVRPSALADLHADMDLALAVALAKAPEDRFDSGQELRAALESAARGQLSADLRAKAKRMLDRSPWAERRGPDSE
jgi:eukaryotic-like serine/threonine-protein kinase